MSYRLSFPYIGLPTGQKNGPKNPMPPIESIELTEMNETRNRNDFANLSVKPPRCGSDRFRAEQSDLAMYALTKPGPGPPTKPRIPGSIQLPTCKSHKDGAYQSHCFCIRKETIAADGLRTYKLVGDAALVPLQTPHSFSDSNPTAPPAKLQVPAGIRQNISAAGVDRREYILGVRRKGGCRDRGNASTG